MGLTTPILMRRLRRFSGGGVPPFTPLSLFSSGEQGAWYDPSDTATLFQDSAGTTAVTAVEQPVGLMLDKSKGLVLGAELVTNGTFNTDTTGWSAIYGANLSNASSTLRVTNSNFSGAEQVVTTVIGKTYRISVSVVNVSGLTANRVFVSTATGRTGTQLFSSGTSNVTRDVVGYFIATTTTTYVSLNTFNGTAGVYADFDNISVRELPGHHAFNPNATTVRPVLSSRYNELTHSEDLGSVSWTRTQVTWAAGIATNTAIGQCFVRQNITLLDNANYTLRLNVKAGTNSWVYVYFRNKANVNSTAYFNATTGQFGTVIGYVSRSAALQSDGSYDLTFVNASSTGATQAFVQFQFAAGDANVSMPSASQTLGLNLVDLRVANESATIPYQRVVTATDYDADPSKFPYYLRFDGSDDWLQTASIDFTATDKMSVFAGVRKLSDAAAGTVVELSATTASNNGTFALTAPSAAAANYNFTAGGTTRVDSTGSAFTAPTTDVLTGIVDISGDSNLLRVDAYQAALNLSDQGTGNFGNYPLYIGRRAGTSLPFSGRLYSLIIRGALTDAATIALAEDYVETKTFGKNMNIVFIDPVTAADGTTPITTADGDALYVTSSYE